MSRSALEILSREQLRALRAAGFVVVHRMPTAQMVASAAGRGWAELSREGTFHRMVGASIREQNAAFPPGGEE